jgi:hypothetical protein
MRLLDALTASMTDDATVERDVFGTDDACAAATAIESFCLRHLGAAVHDCLFYAASIGCVAGVVLDDGRSLVVKAHQPDKSEARLRACQVVQRLLHERGFPAPCPVLGPTAFARGLAVVEAYQREGEVPDAHDPSIRRLLAAGLAQLTRLVRPDEVSTGLGGCWFSTLGPRLWPRPHNALFDFAATASGAEWIDDLAARARAVPIAGQAVVAHFDWRVEHVLVGRGRITTVYDWDSLHIEREPLAVGAAAHAFTARWDLDRPPPPTPSFDEMRAFVAEYEDARGRPFSRAERASIWASCAYSTAYTARCQHARDPEWKRSAGTPGFRDLLRDHGDAMLGEVG